MAGAVRNRRAIERQGLVGGVGSREFDKTVAGITDYEVRIVTQSQDMALTSAHEDVARYLPRVLVSNDLDIHGLSGRRQENALDEVLVHPGFQFAHPIEVNKSLFQHACGRQESTYQRVVFGESGEAPPAGGGTAPMSLAGGVPLAKGFWFGAGPPLAGTPAKGALCSILN